MPRFVFPAGTVTNTTGAPLRLTFYSTSATNRREADLWTVDGSNNLVERIPNGVILTDATGAYGAFAGPDDIDTLYLNAHTGSSRSVVTATGLVAGQGGTWLNSTYVPQRGALRYDPSGKSDGALAASLTADTGQSMTAFASPTNAAPLTISSGVITNTTSGGGTSAGYLQANLGARVRRVGAMVSWPTNALGVFALVIPSAAWSTGVLPNAGFHLSVNGNGIWTLIRFTTGGSTTLASHTTHGRFNTAWGTGQQPFEVLLDPDNNRCVINWPDGTASVVTSAFLGSETSNYAVWELFANTGGTDVGASLGALWADATPNAADTTSPYRTATRPNPPAPYNASGALTIDASKTTMHEVTLTGNLTSLTLTGATYRSQIVHVELVQDATGSRTLSGAAASIKWAGGSAPTLTTTAARRDIFRFRFDGVNYQEISRSLNVG